MKTSAPPWSAATRVARSCTILLAATFAAACAEEASPPDDEAPPCNGDVGLNLPDGFCATVFAENLGRARHMAVTPSGDLFVAVLGTRDGGAGHVVALRDADGDGRAERKEIFGTEGGNGIAYQDNVLYVALNDRILRYTVPDGQLRPDGAPYEVVTDMPADGDHDRKTVVIDGDGDLFVNIGSGSNSCQVQDRVRHSPGIDPCPELDIRAGIWKFDGETIEQTLADGSRYAMGIRNANAMAIDHTGQLWAAQNGRDQLYQHWPFLYSPADDERLPSEEILRVDQSDDFGWPYCYHDAALDEKVLAPEYGGNGYIIGRCESVEEPYAILPAHWAPLGMHFYQGELFPERYQGGLFVANHGSRFEPNADDPPGYNVVFYPRAEGELLRRYETFADGFAGDERPLPASAEHRPVALAESPGGALYISDDQGGTIYKVFYRGPREVEKH